MHGPGQDVHAHGLSQSCHLGPDTAEPDHTQRLATQVYIVDAWPATLLERVGVKPGAAGDRETAPLPRTGAAVPGAANLAPAADRRRESRCESWSGTW